MQPQQQQQQQQQWLALPSPPWAAAVQRGRCTNGGAAHQQQQQQQPPSWRRQPAQQHQQRRPRHQQPGALLLAHINTSIASRQAQAAQAAQPWELLPALPWARLAAAALQQQPPLWQQHAGESGGGARSGVLVAGPGCNQLATLAFAEPATSGRGSSSGSGSGSGSSSGDDSGGGGGGGMAPGRFDLQQQGHGARQHKQQQPQQHKAGLPFWQQHQQQQAAVPAAQLRPGPQFASASPIGKSGAVASPGGSSSGSSSGSSGDGNGGAPPLRALGRVVSGEAAKLLGLAGAQLLLQLANFQRGVRELQAQQQARRRDGGGDGQEQQQQQQRGPFGGWRPRLPWQRHGDGANGGADGQQQQEQHGSGSGGGGAAWQAAEAARAWVRKGAAAERALDLRGALACYTNAVALEPANREYLCRLAKQWSDLTYEEGLPLEEVQAVNARAIEYADRVIRLAPRLPDGHMASCVSRGRLALFSDNRTKVRLAKEAQEAARTAVALDPSNDLAHHLMGRWHFEMAQINFVLRQLIRLVYGAALAPGRFEDALGEFSEAVRLNPAKLIHRVELGRTHLRLGHRREAFEHLAASLALDVEDVNAKLQLEDAELLLAKHFAKERKALALPAPAAKGGGDKQQQQQPEKQQQQQQQDDEAAGADAVVVITAADDDGRSGGKAAAAAAPFVPDLARAVSWGGFVAPGIADGKAGGGGGGGNAAEP